MKAFLPFTLAIVGLITTITIVIGIILPIAVLKYHLITTIEYEYKYDNAQLALLNFLFSPYDDKHLIYRILSEREAFYFNEAQNKIEERLKLFTLSNCFKIVNETSVIFTEKCEAKNNVGEIYIFRPYDKGLIEKLILVFE